MEPFVPDAIAVQPRQTEELTWHSTGAHDLPFGCHIPGRYDTGMKGTFTEAD